MKKLKENDRKDLNRKKNIIMLNNTKGITLIALVVTIIVLIILAGVSINLVFGNLGIVTKAKEAKELQKQAQANEQVTLGELSNEMYTMLGTDATKKDNPTEKSGVEKLKEAKTYMQEDTIVKDSNQNIIKIPQGFKIASDSGLDVTEGIVIEDNDIKEGIGNNRGNQYVWVPVGDIIKSDGTKTTITLGRYTFADGINDKASDGTTVLEKGTPILKQSAENYTQEVLIGSYYKELATYREGKASSGLDGLNTTSRGKQKQDGTYEGIKSFIDSVKANGGYYIARYEASYGTDRKANSKISNSFINTRGTAPTTEGTLWNNITQIDAATASRDIYTTATTDLMNSYAWDTALVYIQEFSGDIDYSWKDGPSIKSSLTNTGANKDERCKINDMASNDVEWTTEYSTSTYRSNAYPCTYRGGSYNSSYICTSGHGSISATDGSEVVTFRPALYM